MGPEGRPADAQASLTPRANRSIDDLEVGSEFAEEETRLHPFQDLQAQRVSGAGADPLPGSPLTPTPSALTSPAFVSSGRSTDIGRPATRVPDQREEIVAGLSRDGRIDVAHSRQFPGLGDERTFRSR